MAVTIRAARPEDAGGLLLLNRAFNGDGVNDAPSIERELVRADRTEIVLVAQTGAALVGFCCGQLMRSMCYPAPAGQITELYVAPESQRQGIGAALIRGMERAFEDAGALEWHLLTGEKNAGARALYERCGYLAHSEIYYRKEPGGHP